MSAPWPWSADQPSAHPPHQQGYPHGQQFAPAHVPAQHQQLAPTGLTPQHTWQQTTYSPLSGPPARPTAGGDFAPRAVGIVLAVVLALAGCVLAALTLSEVGPVGFLLGLGLSLLPLPVIVGCFLWLDRWQPTPLPLVLLAFAYGATLAGLLSGLVNTATEVVLAEALGEDFADISVSAVVAPIVEETTKGVGLIFLVLLIGRKHFTGLVDCIVLAGLVGCGFAFVEDIIYFGQAYTLGFSDDPESAGLGLAINTFVVRGIFTPFAHPLFTMMIGIGLGLALTTARLKWGRAAWMLVPLGWVIAVVLHSLWNLATFSTATLIAFYLFAMVPLFVMMMIVVVVLRQREGKTVARLLTAYRDAGWLNQADVHMMTSVRGRRQARQWAAWRLGSVGPKLMADYQQLLTTLAGLRITGTPLFVKETFTQREHRLLGEIRTQQHHLHLPSHRLT